MDTPILRRDPPAGQSGGAVAINVVPTSIQTTIGGSVKLVTKTYDTGLGSGQPIFGDVLTEQDYDWGTGSHGAMLRQTNTSYLWQTNRSYSTAGLLDLPSSVVVENAGGTRIAETDYTYDESSYLTAPAPGTPIIGPSTAQPNFGQPGGLPEVMFLKGTGPGTVGAPKAVPQQ
jgi:hypothetical protein